MLLQRILGLAKRGLSLCLGLCLASLLSGLAWAQDCAYPLPEFDAAHWQREAAMAPDRGLLWRLDKDGHSSWLYTTLHVNRPQTALPGPRVVRILHGSDVLALELDIGDAGTVQALQQALAQPMPALSESTQQAVQQVLQKGCHPKAAEVSSISRVQLQMALIFSHLRTQDLYPEYGVEMLLIGMARSMKKPVRSLEAVTTQVRALQALTPDDASAFEPTLRATLQGLESGGTLRLLEGMLQMWSTSDLQRLQRFEAWSAQEASEPDRATMARINDARNPSMAKSIAALHNTGQRVFAAVGMLHMTGPLALQDLLRQEGFTVVYQPPP